MTDPLTPVQRLDDGARLGDAYVVGAGPDRTGPIALGLAILVWPAAAGLYVAAILAALETWGSGGESAGVWGVVALVLLVVAVLATVAAWVLGIRALQRAGRGRRGIAIAALCVATPPLVALVVGVVAALTNVR